MKVKQIYEVPDGKFCCLKLYPNGVIGVGLCNYFEVNCYTGMSCGLFGGYIYDNEIGEPRKCETCLTSIV